MRLVLNDAVIHVILFVVLGTGVGSFYTPIAAAGESEEAAMGADRAPRASGVIVKFKATGDHALEECAERIQSNGLIFAGYTADESDSIDRIHDRIRPRSVRALFRRPDERPFREQRAAMRRRTLDRLGADRTRSPPPGSAGRRRAERILDSLPDLAHVYRVEVGPESSVAEAVEFYSRDPHVAWVQPDRINRLDGLPNDPFLSTRGAWGQTFDDLWGLYRINAPDAWEISQGAGIVVAVVDTGLDYDHPDIAENVWINPGEDLNRNGVVDVSDWNGIDDDGNGFVDDIRGFDFSGWIMGGVTGSDDRGGDPDPFDENGHGTHVAGIIAAVADNGIGIVGVAPRARIMALKGFDAEGRGRDSALWRAVLYAAENGAGVVNTSWSCSPACPDNPLAEEVLELVHAFDTVVVTSAGNRNTDVVRSSPEKLSDVITVASSGEDDRLSSSFSNSGWLVDVAAPGGDPPGDRSIFVGRRNILSLRASENREAVFSVRDLYLRNAGTSMAAPHVSGVAALLRSANPEFTHRDVRRAIRLGAADLGPPGHDGDMGAGRLDALGALSYLDLPDLEASIDSPTAGAIIGPAPGPVQIHGTASGRDLLHYELSYAAGKDAREWHRITGPVAEEIVGGVLGTWQTRELEPGEYVLRLEVMAGDGTTYREFLVLSIERNRIFRVSPPGLEAKRPDISGSLVVWESRRSAEDPSEDQGDLNVYVTDLKSGETHPVQIGEGDQQRAFISRGVITWDDHRSGSDGFSAYGCVFRRRTGECPEFPVVVNRAQRVLPVSAGGRIFWIEQTNEGSLVRRCVPIGRGRGCRLDELDLEPVNRRFFRAEGDALIWVEREGLIERIIRCAVRRSRSGCKPLSIVAPRSVVSLPAASGLFFAWQSLVPGRGPTIFICKRDPLTGDCPDLPVYSSPRGIEPQLSGNRLVWSDFIDDRNSDIFFCEYDEVLGECPVQRLTTELSLQQSPRIDGHRVVWADQRSGSTRIFGIQLPRLRPIRDRFARTGASLRIRVHAEAQDPAALELAVTVLEEPSLESLGARFVSFGSGRGELSWTPRQNQVGVFTLTFSASAPGGVVTRRTMQIRVWRKAKGLVLPESMESHGGWIRTAPFRVFDVGRKFYRLPLRKPPSGR